MRLNKIAILLICAIALGAALLWSAFSTTKESAAAYGTAAPVKADFNVAYDDAELGEILSWVDPGKAVSSVAYHRGLLIVPLSFDFGGGIGDGALVAYNVDDPRNPLEVFDTRDHAELYHDDPDAQDYIGDIGEKHGLYFHGDHLLLSDRGESRNGFIILDLGPLYDDDPKTLPKVVSRYYFPGVEKSTVYDGFTFSPAWVGGKYLYAPTGSTGLFIIDTSDLNAPRLLSHLTKEDLYNQVLRSANAIGDLLVLSPAAIASSKGDMVLVDVSDPEKPNLINRHKIKIGYQGILYGSKFYNGGFSGEKNLSKTSELISYDLSDPNNIVETLMGTTEALKKPEYIFMRDDGMYIGHYPGVVKFEENAGNWDATVSAEPQYPPADDYAFSSPLGNLVVLTSDHNVQSKVNIAAVNTQPDKTPPTVVYVKPENGSKNVSVLTTIGISFSDFVDNHNLQNGALVLREKVTGKVIDAGYSHGMGIAHIVPKKPLKKNMTYEVVVTPNLSDMVGNPYVGKEVISEFSTGNELLDLTSGIKSIAPIEVGMTASFDADVSYKGKVSKLRYSWDFGDGTEPTAYSVSADYEKVFDTPGNYNVTLSVKVPDSDKVLRSSSVQVVYEEKADGGANASSTFSLNESLARLFVVNPDNDTLTAIDTRTGEHVYEVPTGAKPVSIAQVGNTLWVSAQDDDSIIIHNIEDGRRLEVISLGYAAAPHGLVFNTKDGIVYVAFKSNNIVQEIDAETYKLERQTKLKGPLRNLAYIARQNVILAPQFIADTQKGATVQWVDAQNMRVENQKDLEPTLVNDGLSNGRGYPNYLGPMAINPEQSMAWIPAKKDNLFRGIQREGSPLLFDHTVRSIAVALDLDTQQERDDFRIDIDNSDFASAATFNAFGNIMYVATMGSQTITAVDGYNPSNQSVFSSYGEGPISMIGNGDATRLYVHNQLSRKISVFESRPDGDLKYLENWSTVSDEKMDENVLIGKRIFHNTNISNLAREGYMSCASCHMDGGHDGRTWDMTSMGEGLRNTIDLRGKAGMKHGPLHWTGNFDEIQDFDDQIVNLNGGTGFLFDSMREPHKKHFKSKAGINLELDSLALYVSSLDSYPKSPFRSETGKMTPKALKGREHFIALDCQSCHSGPTFTDSARGVRHNVGTKKKTSGTRLEKPLKDFDTPTLIGLWDNAPYLHDGSAKTLEDVFAAKNTKGSDVHSRVSGLDNTKRSELMAFLMQIDREEGITARELGSDNAAPKFADNEYVINYVYRFDERDQVIGRVSAVDPDADQQVTYDIVPSVYSNLFQVDKKTGEIRLIFKDIYLRHLANKVLDIERNYNIQIAAVDNGDISTRNVADVRVNVVYPKLGFKNKELNAFLKLNNILDSGKKLTRAQQIEYDKLAKKAMTVPENYNRYEFAH